MKLSDCYIGQKVGFTHDGFKYIGVVKDVKCADGKDVETIEFDDTEDSEIVVYRLIGVL